MKTVENLVFVEAEEEEPMEVEQVAHGESLQRLPAGTSVPWMSRHKGRHPVPCSLMALSTARFLPTRKPSAPSLLQGSKVAASPPDVKELRLTPPLVSEEMPLLLLDLSSLNSSELPLSYIEEREADSDTTVTKLRKRN